MAFCKICRNSTSTPNVEVRASTLCETFVFCKPCKRSAMRSSLNTISAKNLEAESALKAAEEIKSDIVNSIKKTSFKVLVWGPAPASNNPLAPKRVEIKKVLNELGHQAFFSEDLVVGGNIPANVQEALQIQKFDVVINLASSFGSTGEAHELMPYMKNRGLLWLHADAENAFAGNGLAKTFVASGGKVEFYNDDFVECCGIVSGSLYFVEHLVGVQHMAEFYSSLSQSLRIIEV